jgi:hypothetical protein
MRDDHVRRRNARPVDPSRAGAGAGEPERERAPAADRDDAPDAARDPAPPRDPLMRWLLAVALVCIAACVLLLALSGSKLATAAGIVLGGAAFVLLVSAVFYAIGRSEDRDRAGRDSADVPRAG